MPEEAVNFWSGNVAHIEIAEWGLQGPQGPYKAPERQATYNKALEDSIALRGLMSFRGPYTALKGIIRPSRALWSLQGTNRSLKGLMRPLRAFKNSPK